MNKKILYTSLLAISPLVAVLIISNYIAHTTFDVMLTPTILILLNLFLVVIVVLEAVHLIKLHDMAYSDILTGLRNKGYFNFKLSGEIKKANKRGECVSLIMIDVDNFKNVNDNCGHLNGDMLIKHLAEIFEANVRKNDTVIRWGGDEFAIILPSTDINTAYVVAERIRKNVEGNFFENGSKNHRACRALKITISAGVVSLREELTIEKLLHLADKALYNAKTAKNSVNIYAR